ncbi:MAG: glycerol-3-phosphate dehydrogenase [Pseudomonas sp.]
MQDARLHSLTENDVIHDVLVIGGGINGCGIAMDAAGRGLKVLLCEQNDLASATSSRSSKLIHGGLRYLEFFEFRLVGKALAEREILLRNAPHIIRPMRFRLPHEPHLRPAWMIRLGLFLYDHLARRETLPGSHGIRLPADSPLRPRITRGFEYSDAWVDDARLVVLIAQAAAQHGAQILPHTACVHAERKDGLWHITLQNRRTGQRSLHRSRALVNAAGPWVADLLTDVIQSPLRQPLRLVKGSHIVVPRLHPGAHAYILQNEDNRIVFVIPFEDDFSLIGTTDVDYQGDPAAAEISEQETRYLLRVVNAHFRQQLRAEDVIWCFAGVRALADDDKGKAQSASRDYTLDVDHQPGQAPLLSVLGGKITTYRRLGEQATNQLCELLHSPARPWTADCVLPGGDFPDQPTLIADLQTIYPWLPESMARRFSRSYGTLTHELLQDCHSMQDMGRHFGADLYAREVRYLIQKEWVVDAEDLLWRRSKLGLRIKPSAVAALQDFIDIRSTWRTP